MATIAKLQVEMGLDSSGVEKGLGPAKKAFSGLNGMLRDVAATAGGFISANIIGNIAGQVSQLASAGLDFGKEMANVNSIAQLSTDQIGKLSDQVIALAGDPRITQGPAELAAGLYQIVSAGFDTADSLTILKEAAMAASAGLTTSATSTNAIISVLDAYHLSADNAGAVSNTLFQIVNSGVVTFEQLATTIGTVLPTAASLGVSLSDLGAAYTVLTRQGVSADEATTQINAVLTGLLNPTTALTDALHGVGYESGAALLQAKGFGGAMDVLNAIIGGNADVATAMFGNVRALRGILGLTTNSGKDFTAALDEMGHAQDGAGATAKALDKQMKSASYQLQQAKKWMVIAATIGMGALSPAIISGSKAFAFLIRAGVVPLIGFLSRMLSSLSPVVDAIGRLASVVKTAWQGGKSFSDQISKLPGFLQPLGLALVEVVHGVELLRRAFDKNGLRGVLDALPHSLDLIGAGLSGLGGVIGDFAVNVFSGLVDALSKVDWGGVAGIAWELLSNAVIGAAKAGVAIGSVAVDIAEWAIGEIPNVVDWLQGLFGGSQGDATGGAFAPGFGESVRGVTLSDVLLSVLSWAKGTFADVATFIHDSITPVAVNVGSWTLNVGAPTIVFTGTFGLAELAKGIAHLLVDTKVGLVSWTLAVGIPASITIGPLLVPYIAAYLLEKMGVIGLVKWTLNIVAQPVIALQQAGLIENAVQEFVTAENIAVGLAKWTLDLAAPAVPMLEGFMGVVNLSLWLAEALIVSPVATLARWTLNLGAPDLPDITFANLALWVADAVVLAATLGTVGVNADGLKWNISIPKPDLPDISATGIALWLADAVAQAATLGVISVDGSGIHWNLHVPIPHIGIGGGDSGSKQGTSDGSSGGGGGSFGLFGPGAGIGSMNRNGIEPLAIPAPDTTAFDSALKGLDDKLAVFAKGSYVAMFKGDDGDAAQKFTDVMTWGGIWGSSSFTGTFLGDDGDAAVKFTDVMTWGNIWGGSTFTAKFAADNGPAAIAYSDAFGWGDTWSSQVFTATFSIDTSPLYAALDTVWIIAQEINDLLPHSPAKKGPLSRKFDWSYIPDGLENAMSGMGGIARAGVGAVAGAFASQPSPSYPTIPAYANGAALSGRSAGDGETHLHVHVERAYGIADLTEQVVEIAAPALAGAIRDRRVNLGVTPK